VAEILVPVALVAADTLVGVGTSAAQTFVVIAPAGRGFGRSPARMVGRAVGISLSRTTPARK